MRMQHPISGMEALMENHITDTGGLITDASVILAMSFLERIGAPKLKKQLETLAEEGKLVLTEDPALVSGGIGVDSTEDVPTRAWSVLRRLLTLAGEGISDEDTAGFESAFGKFRADEKNFDLDSADPGLTLTVLSMENALKSASNEGGITFLPEAYTHMVDVSDITMEACEKEGVVEDIREVLYDIRSRICYSHSMEMGIDEIFPNRLAVKRLSNSILPTVKEFENGTVVINENFVKLMLKFKRMKMGSYNGPIVKSHGGTNDPPPGMMYDIKTGGTSPYLLKECDTWEERFPLGNFYESLLSRNARRATKPVHREPYTGTPAPPNGRK